MAQQQTQSLLDPLARALVAAVPERPSDDGIFGPGSAVWRIHRERGFSLAGVRALMLQSLHPLAMAGVAQHSSWESDPYGRLAATTGYVLTISYGETAAVEAAAARVRAVHRQVRGVDEVTGRPYSAEDPELLLWVHLALVDSILCVAGRYGRPLDRATSDRYLAEMVRFAELVGVPGEMVPASAAELERSILAVRSELQATPAARRAMAVVLDPPGLDPETRELWGELAQVAIGCLPAWARELHGWPEPAAELLERESVRQLLGVLDLAFEAQPGVLEARRRIELRLRG